MGFGSIPLGPVRIYLGGTSIGDTDGGTNFKYSEEAVKTTADKSGTLARRKVITGAACTFEGKIIEADLDMLAVILGMTVEGTASKGLKLKSRVGYDLVANAAKAIIKPLVGEDAGTDEEEWITIPKASIMSAIDVNFDLANQRAWGFVLEGHPVVAADLVTGGLLFSEAADWDVGDVALLGKIATS